MVLVGRMVDHFSCNGDSPFDVAEVVWFVFCFVSGCGGEEYFSDSDKRDANGMVTAVTLNSSNSRVTLTFNL